MLIFGGDHAGGERGGQEADRGQLFVTAAETEGQQGRGDNGDDSDNFKKHRPYSRREAVSGASAP